MTLVSRLFGRPGVRIMTRESDTTDFGLYLPDFCLGLRIIHDEGAEVAENPQ